MSPGRRASVRRRRRAALLAACLLGAVAVWAVAAQPARAAGTVLFQNLFHDNTVDGTGTVTKPTPTSGTNAVCLTASGNTTTLPLLSCAGNIDTQGSGTLRLTAAVGSEVGGVFGQSSFPTSNGLDVTFNSYQWGGNQADGIAFMLAAVDPANPAAPANIASSGGALGYSAAPGLSGLTNAYLGLGLDVKGNFSNTQYSGTGCAAVPLISVTTSGAVVARGPGSMRVGYCGLTTTYDGTASSKVVLRAATRAASVVPVEVIVNPTIATFTADSGVSAAADTYKVSFTPVGQATRTLTGTLPTVAAGLYPSSSWLNASGVPKQLAFGFVGSTGSETDAHEVSNVKVLTFSPVPQLAVTTMSASAATSQPGAPVTYSTNASVLAGVAEGGAVSVTQTTPAGVVPVGAYGSGWVCQSPVAPSVTCTTSASSFPAGTALPAITVVAVVTGSNITAAFVQANSTARVSAADAASATATTAIAGTPATAPTGVGVTPAIGLIAGGGTVTVTGANIGAATAIEIGTTAEQQAATPVVLFPCVGLATSGCFTSIAGQLVIASMPSRATAATVSVTVVTSGVAAAASYVYADKPATPATPTAVAGTTSATLTWVAPASNGSAITAYTVTPYLAGVAQTPVVFDATTTTRTFSGLTAGATYAFTVAATNLFGTSAASAKSVAVTPYALPGAPAITTVAAGDSAATLTWSAPSSNGAPITGYVVTPFIGATAQTAQVFSSSALTQTVTGLSPGTAYTFTVAAQNLAGTGPASARSSPVTPNASPTLTFASPPSGEVGAAYSRQLTVNNGTSPFVWSLSSGTLPAGLALGASTGLISGTPTAAGTFAFTVQVLDASGQTATRAVSLIVVAGPAVAFSAPAGQVGVAYSQTATVTGGVGPFTWSISAGSPPPGLTFEATGARLSGTPTAVGSSAFTVTVTDANGQSAGQAVTLVIATGPLVIVKHASVTSAVGGGHVAYTITITNTGTTARTGVVVSDPLSGVLDDAVYAANVTATSGTASYAGSTIGWTGDIAAGASITIGYSVTVNSPISGDGMLTNTVTSSTLGTNCAAGSTDDRCVTTTPLAARSITLAGVAPSFTLSGLPHTTVSLDAAVHMVVTTNSMGGYVLSVQAAASSLAAGAPGNGTTIPIDQLRERPAGTPAFRSLSSTSALLVSQSSTASAPGGDAVSDDYQVQIPFAPPASYSVTLNYVASAL
jgi:uncharacterized repeat protein (TIGR01451 family)